MEWFVVIMVLALIIGLGFYAMGKIDIFRRERSRKIGFPPDEED